MVQRTPKNWDFEIQVGLNVKNSYPQTKVHLAGVSAIFSETGEFYFSLLDGG